MKHISEMVNQNHSSGRQNVHFLSLAYVYFCFERGKGWGLNQMFYADLTFCVFVHPSVEESIKRSCRSRHRQQIQMN